jgi:CHAD domain-containing protein
MSLNDEVLNLVTTTDSDRALAYRALALFDATHAAHGLAPDTRPGLALAAVCYTAARQIGAPRPELAGRDAVLATPRANLSPEQLCVVASAVAFQRTRPRRRREPAFIWLPSSAQTAALRLSALLLLADTLCELPESTFQISYAAKLTSIRIGQPLAGLAADAAPVKRWQRAIGPLQIEVVPAETLTPSIDTAITRDLPTAWGVVAVPLGLHAAEPLDEGVRRILRHQFERLLAREESVHAGEVAEEVHQLRVATRRLRASLQVVAPCFDPQQIRRFRRGLRRVAAALATVRDRDVFLEHLHAYQAALPETERDTLTRLLTAVEQDRAGARQTMLASLDTARYKRFKHAFAAFLTMPGAAVAPLPETGVPLRVRDAAGSLLWARYEALRAFTPVLFTGGDEVQHQARIAGKHLRYTIECFAEALGESAIKLLAPLATVQETLGALQDEVTARAYLTALHLADDPGAHAYLASRSAERARHLAALPEHWEQVVGASYRKRLLAVLTAL